MNRTEEQQSIIDTVKKNQLVLVNAVAGSGKTTLLIEIAKELNPVSGLYLAYNKAIATEAQSKFSSSVYCTTTHALAYQATVKQFGLKLGTLNYKNISGPKVYYEDKVKIIDAIRAFCLSKYTDFESFSKATRLPIKHTKIALSILTEMQSGQREVTHDFYLKLFHIMLANGDTNYTTFDFIALDEAGDTNSVTLEIFRLLPATKKIMVGDPYQNIYGFNHTINCFDAMAKEGVSMAMTQSFRVSDKIASRIQRFCQTYIDHSMQFKGTNIDTSDISTKAFISRTNSLLIDKMIQLNRQGIQYGLTRPAKTIFELPLSVLSFKHKGFISAPGYKFLQDDINEYYESEELQKEYKHLYRYLTALYSEDVPLQSAITLVSRHGSEAIISCYEEARRHEKLDQNYMLGTAHSTKGLEFDCVEIADDLNNKVLKIQDSFNNSDNYELSASDLAEFNLYYVACSRAKKQLINAECL